MAEPEVTQKENPAPLDIPEKPEPKIRTMKSDAAELLRAGKESLVSIMTKQATAPEQETVGRPSKLKLFFLNNKKVLLGAGIGGILLILGVIGYGMFHPAAPTEKPTIQQIVPPAFFSIEKSENLSVKEKGFGDFDANMSAILKEEERFSTFKRVVFLIQTTDGERLGNAEEFLIAAGISPSSTFLESIGAAFNFFLYYQKTGIRRGLIIPIESEAKTFRALIDQESFLRTQWNGLYAASDPKGSGIPSFEDLTYRNIDIRRLQLSAQDDLGFYYAIFKPKNYLIITTSEESIKTAIDRIFDAL